MMGNMALAAKNPIVITPKGLERSYEVHFEPQENGTYKDYVIFIDNEKGENSRKEIFKGEVQFVGTPWSSYSAKQDNLPPARSFIKPIRSMGDYLLLIADSKNFFLLNPREASMPLNFPRPPGAIQELAVGNMTDIYVLSLKTDQTQGVYLFDHTENTFQKISETYAAELSIVYQNQRFEIRGSGGLGKFIEPATRKMGNLPKKDAGLSESRALTVIADPNAKAPETAQDQPMSDELQQKKLKAFIQDQNMMRKLLEGMIVGQPEVIEGLLDVEKTDFRRGGIRLKPEVSMFVGLPETGKDTSIESYIMARALLADMKLPQDKRIVKDLVSRDMYLANALSEHLYRVPVVRNEIDISNLIGSGPGYVGSKELTPVIKWLVKHAGGRYVIQTAKDGSEFVAEAANWYPGTVKEGYASPADGVLFLNEFHDWSKQGINQFAKEALEKGIFTIRNPGQGISRIEVPVTIQLASNHSIGRVLSINADGRRVGTALTFDQMMERWKRSHLDIPSLKQDLTKPTPGNETGGMSAEMITRIPNSRLLLMRPLSPASLIQLAGIKLERVNLEYSQAKDNGFPTFRITWSEKLPEFIVKYDAAAETGARSLNDKIQTLVQKTLDDAIFSLKLKPTGGKEIPLDVRINKDGTASLLAGNQSFFIQYTAKEKQLQPLTPKKILELQQIEEKLNARVKGLEHITAQMAQDVRLSMNSTTERPADVYLLLGSSSTGKTELAVALHQVLTNSLSKPAIADCGRIYTKAQIEELILGRRDFKGESIPSLFMQEYDRNNGELVFVLDEISNAPREVQNALYDMLREGVVTTFSDGKPRPMGRVRFVMTGNAGEEWYRGIPREAPELEQYEAARKIYERSLKNPGAIRKFLQQHFSEAFINRVQEHRIFFFGPHTYKTVRELIQLKLIKAIKLLAQPQKGVLNWNVSFLSESEYIKTLEAIETHGFKLWEQGASITGFIENVLMKAIHVALLDNLVPKNTKVTIAKGEDIMPKDHRDDRVPQIGFKLFVEGRSEAIPIHVNGRALPHEVKIPNRNYILTAYHEAGHELVRHILQGHRMRSKGIEIVPGVTEINGVWIRYAGIARSEDTEAHEQFRETIIEEIAVLAAGYMGEKLTTRGERSTSGKSNDIQRATMLAQHAIASSGLSENFGLRARQPGQSMEAYLSTLTIREKTKFSKAVEQFLKEGETLAREVIVSNMKEFFLPLGQHLAKHGRVSGEAIERFYSSKKGLLVYAYDRDRVNAEMKAFKKLQAPIQNPRIDFEFQPFAEYNGPVVDVKSLQLAEKKANLEKADLSPMKEVLTPTNEIGKFRAALTKEKALPVEFVSQLRSTQSFRSMSCRELLLAK